MNEVVEAISLSVTDFFNPDGSPVPVVQLTFTTRSDPDNPANTRVWPALVLRPSIAIDLLRSLSTAVNIVHNTGNTGTPGRQPPVQ